MHNFVFVEPVKLYLVNLGCNCEESEIYNDQRSLLMSISVCGVLYRRQIFTERSRDVCCDVMKMTSDDIQSLPLSDCTPTYLLKIHVN